LSTINPTQSTATPAARTGFRISSNTITLALCVIAFFITGYLTYTKWAGVQTECLAGGMFNCEVVLNSAWSSILGIPTSLYGFVAHVIIAGIVLLSMRNVEFFVNNKALLLFGFTLFFAIYHTYLIYVSFFILRALCPWCLAAATIMYIHLIMSGFRLREALSS
jgi:uncharacterized membrane protein